MGAIVATAITELPAILTALRGAHAAANPDAPVPTDEELAAALAAAVASSVAKDDAWLAAHPAS